MEAYLPLIIQLISGAVGGNLAGSLMKKMSLGTLWNSVVGILGGGLGGTALGLLGLTSAESAASVSNLDLGSIIGSVAGGGIGGGILLMIIAIIKNAMNK